MGDQIGCSLGVRIEELLSFVNCLEQGLARHQVLPLQRPDRCHAQERRADLPAWRPLG
jgi:hypothetical protein